MNKNVTVYIRLFLTIMMVLTLLLIWEYRFFYVQSQKMIELQKQYYVYTEEVKKVLRKYRYLEESDGDAQTLCNIDNSLCNLYFYASAPAAQRGG